MGRQPEALSAGEQAIALMRPLGGMNRSSLLDALVLAMMLEDCGRSLREGGKAHEAEQLIAEAIQRLTGLRDRSLDPARLGKIPEAVIRDNAAFILTLAQAELGLTLSSDPARQAEAGNAFDAAIFGLDRLGACRSPIPRRRQALGLAYLGRGSLRASGGRAVEAESDWNEARKLLAGLVAEFPQNAGYRGPLGRSLGHLGRLKAAKGERAAAHPILVEAGKHLRQALEANPDNPADRQALLQALKDLDAASRPTATR
jgi:tetratricopeptide (TPR) repeat protein